MVNFFAKMCVNVCTGKGSSHHVSNDQTGIICLSELSVLFQKEVIGVETFRLLLKYSKMLLLLFFRLLVTKKSFMFVKLEDSLDMNVLKYFFWFHGRKYNPERFVNDFIL